MNIQIIILAVIASLVGLLVFRSTMSGIKSDSPIVLHTKQGGGVCVDPDWQKWAVLLMAAFFEEGGGRLSPANQNAFGHLFNRDYRGEGPEHNLYLVNRGKDADQNCHDHYLKFGGNYPAHVSPC